MRRYFLALATVCSIAGVPALADEARIPPPTEPYYAPQVATCDLVQLKIYFKPGTAELTPFARDAIREAGDQLSGCSIQRLNATAFAGDIYETPVAGLAERRRTTVMNELVAHGIRASRTAMEIDLGNSVMARNVDIEFQTVPATVG
ncbi:OmpA family protein [Henriciella marina]|uniref:hypothetical protein n=1 Tax=Henriciella marina TaxID=453851 RepID=UPI00037EE39C|nr:hypothetical protein [Henriciella marina]